MPIAAFVLTHASLKNPRAHEIERASEALAQRLGLLDVSNRQRFAAFNVLTPYVYPTASLDRAIACAAWCNWLFFFDDIHDENPPAHPSEVEELMASYLDVLRTGQSSDRADPLVRLMIDFRVRALELCSEEWLERFCGSVEEYFLRGTLPAVAHWGRGEPPRLEAYLVQREFDGAVHTALDLIELANDLRLPPPVMRSDVTQRMRRACARTIAYFNDLVSYPKEVIKHRNPNNLVHVLQHEHGGSLADAEAEATKIVNRCAQTMLDLEPEFIAQDPNARDALVRYAAGLKQWQRGNIDWSFEGARYRAAESLFDVLR